MAEPSPAGDTGQPRFVEHRRTTRGLWSYLAIFALGPPFAVWWLDPFSFELLLGIYAFSLAVVAVFCAKAFSPWGWERKHVRVDASGLWVGGAHLPAPRLGRVRRLGRGREVSAVITGRVCGLKRSGRGSSAQPWFLHRHDHTVLVEDTPRRRAWLVATRHPEALVEALCAVGGHQPPAAADDHTHPASPSTGGGLLVPPGPDEGHGQPASAPGQGRRRGDTGQGR